MAMNGKPLFLTEREEEMVAPIVVTTTENGRIIIHGKVSQGKRTRFSDRGFSFLWQSFHIVETYDILTLKMWWAERNPSIIITQSYTRCGEEVSLYDLGFFIFIGGFHDIKNV